MAAVSLEKPRTHVQVMATTWAEDSTDDGSLQCSVSTGLPAAIQPFVPPSRLVILVWPTAFRKPAARKERFPLAHTTSTSRSLGTSARRSARSDWGTESAPGMRPSAYSSGSRTSRTQACRSRSQSAASTAPTVVTTSSCATCGQGKSVSPRLAARMAVMLRGFAGGWEAYWRDSCSESCNAGLKRRSKPMVLLGRPHMPLPHDPSKWAGNTST